MKVAQLASYCAEVTSYHHGEQSLVQTIINMAQDFVGSNNLNLLLPIGQFGTRLTSKDYASGRYIFTQLNPLVEYIFKKEDEPLLDYLIDDDMNIEPKFYLPIIPMILINGAEGIGTGFSTFIPNYNIIDIIEWFENKLFNNKNEQNNKNEKNNKNNKLEPYYNKFKGKIFKYDDTTYISEGICKIENNIVNISELPIKCWTTPYKEFLDELIEAKNSAFKSYSNFSTDTDVSFTLKIDNQEYINNLNNKIENNLNDLNKLLKLYKTIKLSNLTLYDSELKIKTYSSPEEICEEFYKWRLEWFEKRRLNMIENIKTQVDLISNQIKFIELVKSKPAIFNMEQSKLEEFLKTNKLKQIDNSYDYLINMTFKQLAKANLTKLSDKMNELSKHKKDLLNKTNKDLWIDDLITLKNKL
jgi:DNA topoisomerase-2